MFIGRARELELLESAYRSDKFEMVVVYGRRRVGKTALLNKFISDKPHAALLTAQQTVAQENLERLSDAVAAMDRNGEASRAVAPTSDLTYRTFSAALSHAFESASVERHVLVIDEYPYLAESEPGISSLLQTLIDQHKTDSRLMIVLCGSSMGFMEHQVLGEKSPLYGRRTAQIKLQPFDVFEAAQMLGDPDPQKAVELYNEAIKRGSFEAYVTLGRCHENGTGVEKNGAKAVELYKQAAEKEVTDAYAALARCYEQGVGVEKNAEEAKKWHDKLLED